MVMTENFDVDAEGNVIARRPSSPEEREQARAAIGWTR